MPPSLAAILCISFFAVVLVVMERIDRTHHERLGANLSGEVRVGRGRTTPVASPLP